MKKLICLVLIFSFMLTACSKWKVEIVDPREPIESEQETSSESKKEEESQAAKVSVFLSENGKYGIRDEEGNIVIEAVYDEIVPSKDPLWSGFEAKTTEGTRPAVAYDEYMTPFLTEEENTKTLLLDENGVPIANIAFEEYIVEECPEGGSERWILGVADGIDYRFIEINGKFVLESDNTPRSYLDENGFGYTINTYCYDWYAGYRKGISIGNKVILDAVYHNISVPFKDRILVSDGKFPTAGSESRVAKIIDPEGNIISRVFNDITYKFYNGGKSYIGIAYCVGDDCEVPLHEGTERLPKGYWFVDKNGKIISERFDNLPYSFDSYDEIYEIKDYDGNVIKTINVKNYLLETEVTE